MTQIVEVQNLGKQFTLGLTHTTSVKEMVNQGLGRFVRSFRKRSDPKKPEKTNEFWALRDVSFDVSQGEVLGILGHNGAGKSTLLKILSRITYPTEGRALLRGRTASLLEVGTGFHQELTGRENIFLNGALLGLRKSEIKSRIDAIIEFAEIEKFIDTPVKRYSSGMFVRLAFAVAAHLEPEILILDEVLAVGDAKFQRKCFEKMESIAKSGVTVLYVSHVISSVRRLCDRAVVLNKGSVEFDGDTEEAIRRYMQSSGSLTAADINSPIKDLRLDSEEDSPIQLKGVRCTNHESRPLTEIGTFSDVAFEFDLEVDADYDHVSVEFGIRTVSHEPLIRWVHHLTSPEPLELKKGSRRVRILIPSLPLAAGEYVIEFNVIKPATCYYYKNALLGQLEVQPADVFGNGFTPMNTTTNVVHNCRWEAS